MSKVRFCQVGVCFGALIILLVCASLIFSPSASLAQTDPTAEAEATRAALSTAEAAAIFAADATATAVSNATRDTRAILIAATNMAATLAADAAATAVSDATREAVFAVETMQARATQAVLPTSPPPVTPQGYAHLLPLARAFPANAPLYAVIRSDNPYISDLNKLFGRIQDAIEPLSPFGQRLELDYLIDQLSFLFMNTTFEGGVRPWLGDTIAFGVQSLDVLYDNDSRNDAYVSVGVFLAITDRAQATRALENALPSVMNLYVPQRLGRALIYVPRDESINTLFIIEDNWLAVTTRGYFDYLRQQDAQPAPLLASDERFLSALEHLPASRYNGLAYVDIPQFVLASTWPPRPQERLQRLALMRGIAPTLFGATLLDGYTLTLDIVQPPGDLSPLDALGVTWGGPVSIDPQFAQWVPGGSIYALHGTNLSGAYRFLADNMGALLNTGTLNAFPEALTQAGQSALDTPARLALTTLLGLDLDTDVLAALTGDYVFFVRDNPDFRLNIRPVQTPLDFAMLLEMTDPVIAGRVAERLERALPATTRAVGVPSRFTRFDRMGFTGFAMRYTDNLIDVELLVVYNDDFFFIGTPGALASILQRTSRFVEGLAEYTLPDAAINAYMRNSGATRLVQIALSEVGTDEQTAGLIDRLLLLLDRGVISILRTQEGHGLLRLTLTLSDPDDMTLLSRATQPSPTPTITPTPTPTLLPEEAGRRFLEQNARAEGVVTTASGLQYRIIRRGDSSVTPSATDNVTVHYRGTLVDGTEFDSSYARGMPATFPLFGVIEGWQEGVQLMSPGDIFMLYIPSALAYGSRSPSPLIPPGSVLIFEIELLEIN